MIMLSFFGLGKSRSARVQSPETHFSGDISTTNAGRAYCALSHSTHTPHTTNSSLTFDRVELQGSLIAQKNANSKPNRKNAQKSEFVVQKELTKNTFFGLHPTFGAVSNEIMLDQHLMTDWSRSPVQLNTRPSFSKCGTTVLEDEGNE